jgi:hypothetical protein
VALFGRFGRGRSGYGDAPEPETRTGGSVDPGPDGPLGFEASTAPLGEPPDGAGDAPIHPRVAAPEPRREVEQMPRCSQCGNVNSEGSRFCSNCGSPLVPGAKPAGGAERPAEMTSTMALGALSLADPGEAAEAAPGPHAQITEELASSSALLVVQRGPNAGSRFLLDTDVTSAGRAPDSDIFLDDVTVSRRHAEFTRAAQGYLVRDVGSLNGTYVNRERIEEVLLADGDEVQIGKYRLVFLTGRR